MNWKHLKTFAIAILLVMDIVFVFCVAERRHSMLYYEDSQIDFATTIFRTSDLYVDRLFLEAEKRSPSVYTGNIRAKRFDFLSETMAGYGYEALEEPGGTLFFGSEGEFFFGNNFSFSYYETDVHETPSELAFDGDYIYAENGRGAEAAEAVVTAFLERFSLITSEKVKYAYDYSFYEFFFSGEDCVVHLIQTVDGLQLDRGVYFLVKDGRVAAADGFFAILPPSEKKNAENVGVMNILFAEKAYLDEQRKKETVIREFYVVSDVSYSYGLYFDADGTFYLVPVCTIAYRNGEVRSYNFVSGGLYS